MENQSDATPRISQTNRHRAMDVDHFAESLIREAMLATERSHPANPANLRFGAAVLASSGAVYSSSAYWSDTLSLALHAEQAALAHAAAHNDRHIVAIACVSTEDESGETWWHPCGICKQLLYESSQSSGIDIVVLMANQKGKFITRTISELTPFPWPPPRADR
jgi:cytidine deaminase